MRLSLSTQHHSVAHSSSLCCARARRPVGVAAAKQQAKTGTKKGFGRQQQQHERLPSAADLLRLELYQRFVDTGAADFIRAQCEDDPTTAAEVRAVLALSSASGAALSSQDLERVQRSTPKTVRSKTFLDALEKVVAHPQCHVKSVEVLWAAALHPKRLSGEAPPGFAEILQWDPRGVKTSQQLLQVSGAAGKLLQKVAEQLSQPQEQPQEQQQQQHSEQLEPWTPRLAAELLVLPLLEAVQQCIPESLSAADIAKLAAVPAEQLPEAIEAAWEGCDDGDASVDCARCAVAVTCLGDLFADTNLAKIKSLCESKEFMQPVVAKLVEVALSFPRGVPVNLTYVLCPAAAVSGAEGDLQPVAWAEQLLQHTHHAVMWKAQHEVLTAAVAATAAAAVSASSSERQAWEQQLLQLWRQLLACAQHAEQYMSKEGVVEYYYEVPFSAGILAAALAADGFLAMKVLQVPGLPAHLSTLLLGGALGQHTVVSHPHLLEYDKSWLFPPLPAAPADATADRLVRLVNILLTHTQQQQLWPGMDSRMLHRAAQCADKGRRLVLLPSSPSSSTIGDQAQQAAAASPAPAATSATWHEQVLVHLLAREDADSCMDAAALLCGLAKDSAGSSKDWQQLLAFLQTQLSTAPARTAFAVLQSLFWAPKGMMTAVSPEQLWQLYEFGWQHNPYEVSATGVGYSWPHSKVVCAVAPRFVAAPERLVQMWQQYSAAFEAAAEQKGRQNKKEEAPQFVTAPERLMQMWQQYSARFQARAKQQHTSSQDVKEKEHDHAAAVACALSQLDSSTKQHILTALVSEGQLAESCRFCECQAALCSPDAVAFGDDEDPGEVADELLLLLATTVVEQQQQQQQSGQQLLDSDALTRLLQLCVDRATDAAEAKTPVNAAVLLLQLWHEQQQQRRAASSEAVHMPLTLAQQLVQQLCSRQQLAAAAQLLLLEVLDRAKGEQAGASLAAVVLATLRGLHQGGGSSSSGNTAAQAEQVLQQLLEQLPGHPGAAEASVAALLLVSEPKEVALLYHIARQVHQAAPVAPGLSLQQLGVVTTHVCQCMLAAAASGRSSIRSSSGSAGAGALQVSEQLWQLPCPQQLVADCLAAAGTAQHLRPELCLTLINTLAAANTQLQPQMALKALGLQKQLGLGTPNTHNTSSSGSNGSSSGGSSSSGQQKQQQSASAPVVAAGHLVVAELLSELLCSVDLNAPKHRGRVRALLVMVTPAAAATAVMAAWLWSGECPAATAALQDASTGKAAPQWPDDPTALWQLCQQLLLGPGRKAGQSNDHELLSLLVGRLQLAAVLQAGAQQQAMQLARDTPGLLLPLAEHWQRQQLAMQLADASQLLQQCVAAGTAQAAAAAELLVQLLESQGATEPAAVPSELSLQLVQLLSVHGKIAAAQQQLAQVFKHELPPAAAAVVPAVTALAAGAATAGEGAAAGVLQLLVSAPIAQQLLVAALDVATGKPSKTGTAALLLHALQRSCQQQQEQQQPLWPMLLSSQQLERLCSMVADTAAATGAQPSAGLTALPSGLQLAADLLAASKSHTSSSSSSDLKKLTLTPAMVTHLLNALSASQPVLVPANAAAALGLLRPDTAARAGEGLPRQSNDSADSSSGSGSGSVSAAAAAEAAVSTRVVAELCYSLLQAAGCKDEPSAAAEWALEWTEQQQPQLTPEAAAAAMFAAWLWAQHADTVARQQARSAIIAALESGSAASSSAGWDGSRDGVSLAAVAQVVGAQRAGPGFGLRHSVAAVCLQLYKHVRSQAGRPSPDSLLYDLGLLAAAAAGQWEEGGNIISAAERAAAEHAAADRQPAAGARGKAATAAAATPGGSWVPLFTPAYAALAEVQVRELGMQKASEWLLTCLSARQSPQQEPKQAAAGKKGRDTAIAPAAATSAAAAGVSAEEQVVVLNAFLSAAAEVVSCAQAEGADEVAHEAATAAVAAARSLLLVDIVTLQEAASRAKLPAAAAGAGGSMAGSQPDCLRADRFTWSHLVPLLAAAGQYKLLADIILAAAAKQLPGLEAARNSKQYALRLQHLLAAAAAAFNAAGAPEAVIALCDALSAAGGRQITVSGFAEQLLEASASNEQGLLSYLEEEDDVLERLLVLSDGDSTGQQERSLAVRLRQRPPAAALAALHKQLSEVVKQL